MIEGRARRARWVAAAATGVAVVATIAVGVARRGRDEGARCGAGFVAKGPRCLAPGGEGERIRGSCPTPLAASSRGCEAPDARVFIPSATIIVGSSDWEAEGRLAARTIHVEAFWIDAFEVTRGRWAEGMTADRARAASGMTRDEAAAFCSRQASPAATGGTGPWGRLPTEDEWIAAAVSGARTPSRYPWGETGAVCRRAAWGLRDGPCARGAEGPDTVGAHTDGDSPLGLHDMAGNVAEWVTLGSLTDPIGVAKGGSWQTDLASDLRVWTRFELSPDARDPRVGLRCVYPP